MPGIMHKLFMLYSGLLILTCYLVKCQFPDESARPIVDEVETAKYAARWYPTYGNVYETHVYLEGDFCAFNDFTLISDLACNGNNQVRVGAINGTWAETPGLLVFNGNGTGNITYIFYGIKRMKYYISKLGPDTFGEDNLYQYAVVWSPNMYNSFILSRDPADFKETYRDEVFAWMNLNGFEGWYWNVENGEIYQGPDCDYPPQPEPN